MTSVLQHLLLKKNVSIKRFWTIKLLLTKCISNNGILTNISFESLEYLANTWWLHKATSFLGAFNTCIQMTITNRKAQTNKRTLRRTNSIFFQKKNEHKERRQKLRWTHRGAKNSAASAFVCLCFLFAVWMSEATTSYSCGAEWFCISVSLG